MADLAQVLPAVLSGGVATWLGNLGLQWLKGRSERDSANTAAEVALEQHRDKLTFDLLAAARSEVAAARDEAAHLRPLQTRLAHFEEALDHIEALLNSGTPEERAAAERRARAFLNRMRRMADAIGTLRNEAQIRNIGGIVGPVPDELLRPLGKLDGEEPTG